MKILRSVILLILIFALVGCSNRGADSNDEYFSAVWVATTANLDFPSKPGLSGTQIEQEIEHICQTCLDCGIKTIFLQVRGNADAIYDGSIFGASISVYGTRKASYSVGYDILERFLAIAHRQNLKVYAWINPYRIGSGEAEDIISKLDESHPAHQHPEIVMKYSGGAAFNPGAPLTTQLILQGLREVCKYNVDGVVFDDYFYPYDGGYDDSTTYQKYGANFTSVDEFRRYSVNNMVRQCSEFLHGQNITFGISPFGIWSNAKDYPGGSDTDGLSAYHQIYADSKLWVEQGWLDFVAPQIYWSTLHPKAPFEKVFDWWCDVCANGQTKLYVSHYVSRIGSELTGWEDVSQLDTQLKFCVDNPICCGDVLFRYGDLAEDRYNVRDTLIKYFK